MTKRPEPATVALPCLARLPLGVVKSPEPKTRAVVAAHAEPATRAYPVELLDQLTESAVDRDQDSSDVRKAEEAAQQEPAGEPLTTIWARPKHAIETILLPSSEVRTTEPVAGTSKRTRAHLLRPRVLSIGALALCVVIVTAVWARKSAQLASSERIQVTDTSSRVDATRTSPGQSTPAPPAPAGPRPQDAPARPEQPPPSVPSKTPSRAAISASARLRTERLRAVDLLAAGKYEEALTAYRGLAAELPHEPVHAAIAVILERRLAERCSAATARGRSACE